MGGTEKSYWDDYNNLQRVKHEMLRRYLGAWFPILTRYNGRVLFVDTHAGKGRHTSGEEGSPLIAVRVLLGHQLREQILANAEISFVFLELDEENAKSLQDELSQLGGLPKGVKCHVIKRDFADALDELVTMVEEKEGFRLAPLLLFVDPFTFLLPTETLAKLLAQDKCEIIVNFMWRYIDMALANESHASNMDRIFGAGQWQQLRDVDSADERCDRAIELLAERLGAAHALSIKMLGANNSIKYVLLHLSNNEIAFEKMKEVLWALTPQGDFRVHQKDSDHQPLLLTLDPDLSPLETIVRSALSDGSKSMDELYKILQPTLFLKKHLHEVLRTMRDDGSAVLSGYEGRFAFSKNPTVTLSS